MKDTTKELLIELQKLYSDNIANFDESYEDIPDMTLEKFYELEYDLFETDECFDGDFEEYLQYIIDNFGEWW